MVIAVWQLIIEATIAKYRSLKPKIGLESGKMNLIHFLIILMY